MPTAPERKWGTVDEAARAIFVHPLTIRKWLAEGRIKGAKIGRCVRVDLQALETQLEEQTSPRPKAARPNGGICAGRRP